MPSEVSAPAKAFMLHTQIAKPCLSHSVQETSFWQVYSMYLSLQAKVLAIELYKWIGAAVKPALEKSLKPVQVCRTGGRDG